VKTIVGIDEVGRGPIAGPVAVCAFVIFDEAIIDEIKNFAVPLFDSKQLSKRSRELWFDHLVGFQKQEKCDFCVSMVSANEIDRIGISKAIKKALAETLDILGCEKEFLILLDGSLYAPAMFTNQITIIKGDEKEPVISFASIIAKVTRDRYMTEQAKKFPKYGFENHVGYGTQTHYEAIKKYGLTKLHRRSFLKNFK